ncbi:osmoprotectant transport system permease protein [Arthrobacter pigmenti]|uniref:Osmoprotectant transport system permease protein n=1 Tax=Arthrobacter pigmenti TaxID=271432 RepID=A0A846RTB2_9MICC|nr:ABC transporter permease [Arthrobacter pigmenti]NJC23734.1 osmoprotectant transport system permease protein [Arthrobacter pigmenti]
MTDVGTRVRTAVVPSAALPRHRSLAGYLVMPAILASACLIMYLYVSSRELDSIEARSLNAAALATATWEHIQLTAVSTLLTLVIAVPLGILLTRPFTRRFRPYLITLLTLGQAIPTIAVLVLLAVAFLFLGFQAAVVGLVLYAIIPVLLNTMVGLEQVDESVLEAGRGMGISKSGVLFRLELPLSVPIILAGVRTALVINVGTATLTTYINAGGLGDIIVAGLSTNRVLIQIIGAALTAVLALLIDYLAGIAEDFLRPKGL